MSHRQGTGSALIMAVFMLALVTSMGVSLLFLTGSESIMRHPFSFGAPG